MIIDNKQDWYPNIGRNIRTLWDFITAFAGKDSGQKGKMDIVTGYFTIKALSNLQRALPEDDEFRIVSSEMVNRDEGRSVVIDLLNGSNTIQDAFELDRYAEEAKAFLSRENVDVRAIVNAFCHAKAYIFHNKNLKDSSFYSLGSSNLTDAGMGLRESSNIELNEADAVQLNNPMFNDLCRWFDQTWRFAAERIDIDPEDPKLGKISVKEYFIKRIEQYYRKYSPEEVYYKILYELFNSDIENNTSIEHERDMSLLQTSVIWNTLFNYQQKGVISLIKMLRRYNGAILADAVGLGKTFSALAVIKYFSIQNYTTVLLCPKKLEENWTQYLRRAGSRFEKDEFDYEVRFHTDLQDNRLEDSYSTARLSWLNRRQKLLIVIDESHNLRNEKSNRYKTLMESLILGDGTQARRDVKVLMLSATPINTGLKDIKGQFNLIAQGNDGRFDDDEFKVESLNNLFRSASQKYAEWCKRDDRTVGGFVGSLQGEFFNLTDKLIVARTRKLIENTLGEDLGFPRKAKPLNLYQGVERLGGFETTEQIYAAFDALHLTAYQPSLYIPETQSKAKREAGKDWSDNVNRERFLVKMMGILFLKRLESSWWSCKTTVDKVLAVHEATLQKVLDYEKSQRDVSVNAEAIEDESDERMGEQFTLRKGSIRLSEMRNLGGFKRGLQHDVKQLREIAANLKAFEDEYRMGLRRDEKLDELERIIKEKQKQENRKIVIFTAYADTAEFLFDELRKRGVSRMASVSGSTCRTTGGHSTRGFREILQSFAPYSKLYKEMDWDDLYEDAQLDKGEWYDDGKMKWRVSYEKWKELIREHMSDVSARLDDGLDVLIATDCLSEGQNLQDADTQVNYDIHWNPVRLIQRFGRIDRIGSPNAEIRCVNFWPARSFEDYLHLEERIVNRMAIMNLVGSETQEVNDAYVKMVEDNPLQDKNADRLLQEFKENSISDIEQAQTLSLVDLSFEVYRQDFLDYIEKYKDFFLTMPNGVFTGFRVEDDLFEQIPESLVAVVGYPHRQQGEKKPYRELYLMCQPIDNNLPVTYHELNRAEILEFLRRNKRENRYLPDWVMCNDDNRLERLTSVLRGWMQTQVPKQATADIKGMLGRKVISKPAANGKAQLLEEKFKLENFDLIVWEYVSRANG